MTVYPDGLGHTCTYDCGSMGHESVRLPETSMALGISRQQFAAQTAAAEARGVAEGTMEQYGGGRTVVHGSRTAERNQNELRTMKQ